MSWIWLILIIIGFLLISYPGWRLLFPKFRAHVRFDENKNGLNPKKAVEWLLESLDNAQSELKIVTGELSPIAYNDCRVVEKMKEKLEQGVNIKILSGPFIYGNTEGQNKTWKVVEENRDKGTIALCFLERRPQEHFRIADRRYLALERPHHEFEHVRKMKFIHNSFFEARKYEKRFDEMWGQATFARSTEEKRRIQIDGREMTKLKLNG